MSRENWLILFNPPEHPAYLSSGLSTLRDQTTRLLNMVIDTMILALKWDHRGELSGIDRSTVMGALVASGGKKQNDQAPTTQVASENHSRAA
jgi:hypothetical protein